MAAAAMAGPAAKMIAAGARGQPIDALDIAAIVVAGATAAIPGMSGMAATAMRVGTTAASFTISAVQVGQDFGMIPSTCITNCPPPPDYSPEPPIDPRLPPVNPPPSGQKSDEEILALAPECTFFRVVGKSAQPAPCNTMPRATRNGPPHYTEEDWIAKYRADHYGTASAAPGGAIETPEQKAIRDAANVPKEEDPPLFIDELDIPILDLDLGDMPALDLDLGEMPALDLDLGEMPALDLDLGEMPNLDLVMDPNDIDTEIKETPIAAPVEPSVPFAERQLEPACYAKRYPDLVSFYKINVDDVTEKNKQDLLQHWSVYGKREGRNPSCKEGAARKRGGSGKSLTLYYADWCHFCKMLMPIWKKLGSSYKSIPLIAIEEKQNNSFPVEGYPTLIYRDGSYMEKYSGPRTKSGIESFLKNKL
jgi:thiol-disulfide isomerase/thioredoxin